MPLYEYKCLSCGRVFELMQKFSDPEATVHEGCGGALERLISPPAFQFKGSGWYVTDYARGKGGGNGKRGDDVKPAEPAKAGADSKPASPPPPKKD